MKPITDAPDVTDLKNGSSKTYTEAMKELTMHQRLLKPKCESSVLHTTLQPSSSDQEACIVVIVERCRHL